MKCERPYVLSNAYGSFKVTLIAPKTGEGQIRRAATVKVADDHGPISKRTGGAVMRP